jgi:hypothetical protein
MTTVVKTEGKHSSEFILSEGNGDISRENGVLASGQSVVDGQVMKKTANKLVKCGDGDSEEQVVGIIIGNHTVTADTPVVYIARDATVKGSALTYGTDTSEDTDAELVAGLADLNIIVRD